MFSSGYQLWTVPSTRKFKIILKAAGNPLAGTFGACIVSIFKFNAGEKLQIIVGQSGRSKTSGSGGSFVVLIDEDERKNKILMAAGGAGGAKTPHNLSHASSR